MNLLRENKIKRICACFLFALLVFINAIKAFHHHHFSALTQNKSVNKNATVVEANVFCSICAFQIAKDSDAVIAIPQIIKPVYFTLSYFAYTELFLYNFSSQSFVRGPPAFIA